MTLKIYTTAAQWSYGSIFFQTELMVEIYSKSLVRAIGTKYYA